MVVVLILPAIILFSLAGYLAYIGREGWGWFLFVGLLTVPALAAGSSGKSPIFSIELTQHEPQSTPSNLDP